MKQTSDGGLVLTPSEVDGLKLLLRANAGIIDIIRDVTIQDMIALVDEWERVMGMIR